MDSEYLKKHLGGALTAALAEAVEKRPLDPIEFIAQYLYKLKENEAAEKARQKEDDLLNEELRNADSASKLAEELSAEAKLIQEQEEAAIKARTIEEKTPEPTLADLTDKPGAPNLTAVEEAEELPTPAQEEEGENSSKSPDLVPDENDVAKLPSSPDDTNSDGKKDLVASESFASGTSETSKEAEQIVNQTIANSLAVVENEGLIQQEPVPPREVESGDEASKTEEEEAVKPRSVSFAANVQQVEISPRPSESSEDFVTAPIATDSINVPEVEVVPPSPVQVEPAEPSEE